LDYDDPHNSLFISLHGYDENQPRNFYPSSGSLNSNTYKDDAIYPGGVLNVPISENSKCSYAYRNLFRLKVVPRLNKFKPDLIFISAGFDGHENEEMNIGYMKLVKNIQ
jgi:acetoin utilization deacetylase AcuC-like enzyme